MSEQPYRHQAQRLCEQPSHVIRQLIKIIAKRVVMKLKAKQAMRSRRPQDKLVPIDEKNGA